MKIGFGPKEMLKAQHLCIQVQISVQISETVLGEVEPEPFPTGSDCKESARSVGDPGSILGSGRSPGEGNAYPL